MTVTHSASLIEALRLHANDEKRFSVETRGILMELAANLECPDVTVAFGGHFSTGKSTLLNALIERDLLPTNDMPETGVACVLRAGDEDTVETVSHHARESIPCTPDSLAAHVSLLLQNGDENPVVQRLERVELSLRGVSIPARVAWVDLPGINESRTTAERARQALAQADVLVWVLTTQALFSLAELNFLSEFIHGAGTDGILFVVNVFMSNDSVAEWEKYHQERLNNALLRIRDRYADLGIEADKAALPFFVSARAMAQKVVTPSNQSFGGDLLRRALLSITSAAHPRVQAVRLHRAALVLSNRVADRSEVVAQFKQDALDQQAAYEAKLHLFKRAETTIVESLTRFQVSLQKAAKSCAEELATSISKGSLKRGTYYSDEMNRRMQESHTVAFAALLAAVNQELQRTLHTQLSDEQQNELAKRLAPSAVTIVVSDNSLHGGRVAGGAAAGAAIGSVVPVIGTVFGAVFGMGVGIVTGVNKAIKLDCAQTQANIRSAEETLSKTIEEQYEDAKKWLRQTFAPKSRHRAALAHAEATAAAVADLAALADQATELVEMSNAEAQAHHANLIHVS